MFRDLETVAFRCSEGRGSLIVNISTQLSDELDAQSLALLTELVRIPSGTLNLSGVARVQSLLERRFQELGLATRQIPLAERGPILVAENPLERPIVILAHADTVYGHAQCCLSESGDNLFGPGVLDLKAAIVATIAALRILPDTELQRIPLRIVINSAEENPDREVAEKIRALCSDARAVLVMEYGRANGGIVLSRKGRLTGRFTLTGEGGHSGNVNTVEHNPLFKLGHVLNRLEALPSTLPGVSINPACATGGSDLQLNMIPRQSALTIEARFPRESQQTLLAELANIESSIEHCTYKQMWFTEARECSPQSQKLFETVQEVSARLELPCITLETVGGLSDLNLVPLHIPAVDALGPIGGHAHIAEREWVSKTSIVHSAIRLALLLKALTE